MTEWLTARAAADRIFKATHSMRTFEELILHAQTGLVRTQAAVLRFRFDGSVERGPVSLPEAFWSADIKRATSTQEMAGVFHGILERNGRFLDAEAAGVTFNRADLERVLGKEKEGATVAKSSKNAGRRRDPKWHDWVAYLTLVANDIVRQEGPEALMDKVADAMALDGLEPMSRSTVQPAAQAVIALMEAKKL